MFIDKRNQNRIIINSNKRYIENVIIKYTDDAASLPMNNADEIDESTSPFQALYARMTFRLGLNPLFVSKL